MFSYIRFVKPSYERNYYPYLLTFMNEFYIDCKTCVPSFSGCYWWQKSQHRKFFGLILIISAILSLIGTLYLTQARNDEYLLEVILEFHYFVKLIVGFVFLILMQLLCYFLVNLLYHIQIERYSSYFLFWIKIIFFIVLFHLLLPLGMKQIIIFLTTYVLQLDIRETGYLDYEYHRMCKWMLIYASVLLSYCYYKEIKIHLRSVKRVRNASLRLSDELQRRDLSEYLENGFMAIVKRDIVLLVNAEGELSIMGRKNDTLSAALRLGYTQISKSVFIVTTAILVVAEDHVEISIKHRETFDMALKKYKKLAEVAVEFKSEHGLLMLSPVYGGKLGKR